MFLNLFKKKYKKRKLRTNKYISMYIKGTQFYMAPHNTRTSEPIKVIIRIGHD